GPLEVLFWDASVRRRLQIRSFMIVRLPSSTWISWLVHSCSCKEPTMPTFLFGNLSKSWILLKSWENHSTWLFIPEKFIFSAEHTCYVMPGGEAMNFFIAI